MRFPHSAIPWGRWHERRCEKEELSLHVSGILRMVPAAFSRVSRTRTPSSASSIDFSLRPFVFWLRRSIEAKTSMLQPLSLLSLE